MFSSASWREFALTLLSLGMVAVLPLSGDAQPVTSQGPQSIADLRRLGPAELAQLFACGQVGEVPVGDFQGQVLYLTDRFLPRCKAHTANLFWRGKYLGPDTSVCNRWIGNRYWIGSHYVIGPSWADGKPAVIVEYPRGTPLFANMHDELREIAPGLLLGVLFDKEQCRFRGYLAIEVPKECSTRCR